MLLHSQSGGSNFRAVDSLIFLKKLSLPKRKLAIQIPFSLSSPIPKTPQIKQNLGKILAEKVPHCIGNFAIGLYKRCSYMKLMESHLKPIEYKVSGEL